MRLVERNPHPNMLRSHAMRPAYLDHPALAVVPTDSFWDEHKHQIWFSIIAAIIIASVAALFESWSDYPLC